MSELNGILCIDKPAGFTSFDVVAKLRGITKTRRIGHGGTLDPMATGVLPLFFGVATKACDALPDDTKAYTASFSLGMTTDTQDCTGTVLSRSDRPVAPQALLQVLPPFTGEIMQVPPMYSAVQINGQRLYDLARQGVEVERPARKTTVYALELTSYDAAARTGTLTIECARGTYVRTIIHDIGQALSCGAVMTALTRTRSSGFTLADCVTIEQAQALAAEGRLAGRVLPLTRLFEGYPRALLDKHQAKLFINGVRLDCARVCFDKRGERIAVYHESELLGLAGIGGDNELIIQKTFFTR